PTASASAASGGSSANHIRHSGNTNSNNSARPPPSSSRQNEGWGRMRGVGANPDDHVQQTEDRGASDTLDPCWRCGEAVRLIEFGHNRYFGCSSHPLCKATRRSRKNGAVVELIAEEDRHGADAAAMSSSTSNPGTSAIGASSDPTGITRCHLCVKVRGGHVGGAARTAWEMLRRNGITPLRVDLEGPGGGDARGNINNGGSSSVGTNADSTGTTSAVEVARVERLKAVMELGKRDSVRRLLKQEGMTYRDIPQTTYSSLMASGAGDAAPKSTQERGKNVRAKKDKVGRLDPLDTCEAMLYSLPAGLRETLLPFQRDGVLYGLRRKGRCLIADEMGTGKTLQALAVMGCYREDWPLLIVAPASMRLMWAEEVEHWYPFLSPSQIHLIRGNKDKLYLTNVSRHLWPRVVIVSYFMLRMLADSIGKGDWNAVIFDESHMISTKLGEEHAQAQQVTVCLKVAQRAKRVVMLSGTPSLSKPFDLFNQVEAISPGLLMGRDRLAKAKNNFAANYCGGAMRGQKSRNGGVNRVAHISGSDYPDELHLLLKNEVMIRRLKINVVKQLPPLRRIVVRVEEHGGALKRALQDGGFEVDADVEEADDPGGGARNHGGPGSGAGLMSDDQRAGLKKVKSASEWVVDKLAASQETLAKFVVFAHHKTVLDRLQEATGMQRRARLFANKDADASENSSSAFSCLRIDGSVPTASRLSEFNTNERCRVLVVSITAGGQGLDFTAASNVVFVELPESPAWLRQAEDRLHRRRQEKSVNVYLTVLPAGSHDDTRWLSLSEKLVTQTSVMNGTLNAENIDVDRVCDAGGIMDDDAPERWRRHRNSSMLPQNLAGSDVAGGGTSDGSNGGLSDDTPCFDFSGCDGAIDDVDDGDDGGDSDDDHGMEADLDAELRNALLSTPLEVPKYRPSQSPTFRLLRAIAESPTPGIVSQRGGSATKMKGKARSAGNKVEGGKGSWLGRPATIERKPSRSGNTDRERAKGMGKDTRFMSTATTKEGRRTSMASPAGTGSRNRHEAFASPAVSRKRPRSSPASGGTASASRSGNPFKAFGHRFRPPPPSPSSRLGVDGGSPPPPLPPSPAHFSAGGSNKRVGSAPTAPGVPKHVEVSPRAGLASSQPAAGDSVDVSVSADLSQSADEDSDDFAVTPSPSRRHLHRCGGTAGGAATSVISTSHKGEEEKEDESMSSPVLLVDLSQSAEENASLPSATHGAGAAALVGEGPPSNLGDALPGAFSPTRPSEDDSRRFEEVSRGGGVAAARGNDDDSFPSPFLPSGYLSSGGGGYGDPTDAEQGKGDEEGRVGGEGEERRQGQEDEEKQQLLASKLYFLVSANTGRVHVYKKEEDGQADCLSDSSDDDEDEKLQHCSCNFRPEDLDRLFEASKEALLVSTKTSTSASPSTRPTTEACEAAAREALSMLPKLLRFPPALRVARAFVQEWRALSSRKRPLLKGIPCRPPLAEKLSRVTPVLTGSTRRHADIPGGAASGGVKDSNGKKWTFSVAWTLRFKLPGKSSIHSLRTDLHDSCTIAARNVVNLKVICLFCEDAAASEQGPHVHRRDRFCSVDCME
ncbi:unnamed protein product, partial [Hapterophycus canaliculatus]